MKPAMCVEWQGARSPLGYGKVRRDGKTWLAHRAAWVDAHGPIPAGMVICHRCDNPACINVEHLFLGTQRDNMRDAMLKGRTRNGDTRGESNAAARLTEVAVRSIRERVAAGERRADLAREFGMTRTTITHIVARKTWRHI